MPNCVKPFEGSRSILGDNVVLLVWDKSASSRMTDIEEDHREFKVEDIIANECCAITLK
jgi:hypothetical protein